jgi:amino acid transporter
MVFFAYLVFSLFLKKYKNKSWTLRYIRSNGIGCLVFGITWFVLYLVFSICEIQWPITGVLIALFTIPSLIYIIYIDKKYKAKLENESEG